MLQLLEDVVALKAENAALREEIARLKGHKGPPKLKPSGMEKATEPARAERKAGRRGGKIDRLVIDEERVLKAAVPPGSRFKGYETYVVQELILRPHVIRYRRERWITPDGRTVVAALPAGTVGHFGPELRRFVLAQYHPGQVTVPRIVAQLRDLGMAISKRQVVRLLIAGKEDFLAEAAGVLKSGLESAAWITVDDTGARYKGMNGACTHIGNTDFAWFATTRAKIRLNFLALLRAGATDYVINDEALAYMRGRSLSGLVIARLAGHKSKRLKDQEAWMAHLERLGITRLRVHPDPLKIATEGVLWGSVVAHGLLTRMPSSSATTPASSTSALTRCAGHKSSAEQEAWMAHLERIITRLRVHPDPLVATEGGLGQRGRPWLAHHAVIVSDDAGQFNVGSHALCWVHAERLIHKLVGFNHRQRQACARIRARVWWFYADLKAYCRDPTPRRKRELQARFDRLFTTTTGFATLDRLLARLHANKIELLRALERPDIPLHTNGSENDIRCQVTRRKISGGTRSETGRDCRDAFLGLMKTCDKLGVSFWDYLGSRLDIPGAPPILPLPDLIRQRAAA